MNKRIIIKIIRCQLKRIKILLLVLIFFSLQFDANSQSAKYKENGEVGFFGGGSYYLGDLNSSHFHQSLPTAGLIIRKNIDKRISYKTEILFLSIKSDERGSVDTIAKDRGLHFKSSVYELSGQVEFNFLPYEMGNPLYQWTPFIYTGISIFHFNPKAENKDGLWVDLQPLGTEGQGTREFPERNKYSLIQFAIPIGGGIKIAVNESFNIILEYGARKTFTDYLDDVSTTYPGKNIYAAGDGYPIGMTQEAIEMSDPNILDGDPTTNHNLGEQRGNTNDNNDWYSFVGITLSFKINNNKMDCDY